MEMLNWVQEVMDKNVREAHKYAEDAFIKKPKCKAAADWCRDMANMHLQFNTSGAAVMKKIIDHYEHDEEFAAHMPGAIALADCRHAQLMKHTAEVRAMLDMYE